MGEKDKTNRPGFIEGEKVNLVPLTKDDAEVCFAWLNHLDTLVTLGSEPLPSGLDAQREYLAKLYERNNRFVVGVQRKADGVLIGTGGLSRIEWINQRAELTLMIGPSDQRGKGYGREASMLILRHAFEKLNLHSVMLRVLDYNTAGKSCYEKCGFKLIGRRREAKAINNEYSDVLYMDILAEEFAALDQ